MEIVVNNRTRVIETRLSFGQMSVDGVVVEEDTALVLGPAVLYLSESDEHMVRVMTRLHDYQAPTRGQIVQRKRTPGGPLRLAAIVHDFDCDPSVTPEVISQTLAMLWQVCDERGLRTLVTQPLGSVHGSLTVEHFGELLFDSINFHRPGLETIWIALN